MGRRPPSQREDADNAALAVATALRMTVTPGSGATQRAGRKTDALDDLSSMEHKQTHARSFAVTLDLLLKLQRQANLAVTRSPMFCITFENAVDLPKQWVVLPLPVLKSLRDDVDALEKQVEILRGALQCQTKNPV